MKKPFILHIVPVPIGTAGYIWDHRPLCGSREWRGEAVLHVLQRFPVCSDCLVELDRYQEFGLVELGETKKGDPMWVWRKGVQAGGRVDRVWWHRSGDFGDLEVRVLATLEQGRIAHEALGVYGQEIGNLQIQTRAMVHDALELIVSSDAQARAYSRLPPGRYNARIIGAQFLDGRLGRKKKKGKK